jgi:amino acid transporter
VAVNEHAAGAAGETADLSPDEVRLHELGYAQELRRRMSGFSNFAVSFTIISILSGCLTLYGYGMGTGGPTIIVWGWPIVGIMTLMVGLSMAEVCSSFPTAGGLYYWSAKLAKSNGPAWSWFTGWFNFLGQVAVTAGIDFGCAFFINALLSLQFGTPTYHWVTILIFAAVLLVHGLLNQFGIRLVSLLNDVSVWWHILGVLLIVGVLVFVPSHHASASYVFTSTFNDTGWHSIFYVLLLGLLLAQYTFTGYDASAHMTEETHDAARSGPRGIVMSILVSLFAGWILLIGITFAIHKTQYSNDLGALVPPAQVFANAIGDTGAKFLLLVAIGAQLFCGMSSVTANSRMIYAFSRDGALPGSAIWHVVERDRVRGGHLDRDDRPVHRLRVADVPAAAAGRAVQARPVAPGPVEQAGRHHRGDLGGVHHDLVHAARREPGDLEDVQLHGVCRGGRGRVRWHLVAGVGPQVVHRAEGPGQHGRAGRHRTRARGLRRPEPRIRTGGP